MIKLYGQIAPVRLYGQLNIVPSASGGSGGPLQAKTAYPSHSEQIIAPDDNYYGLAAVTIKPVPRLPFCEVTISTPSGIEYYYNHEQLPEIPADVMAEYPYIVIMRSPTYTRIYACIEKPYFDEQGSETIRIRIPNKYVRYSYNASAKAWVYDSSGNSTYFSVHGDGNWCVWWSNTDVPNGSADSAETYFPATEPKAEQPADATRFYYNGIYLPPLPTDGLTDYPYWVVLCWPGGNTQAIGSKNGLYFNGGTGISDKNKAVLKAYNLGDGQWVEDAKQSGKYTSWTCISNGVSILRWSNHNIPNGSADATDIYYSGTLAVPAD